MPRRELLAEHQLRAQGYECFLPQIVRTVRHARQSRTLRVALFPRYVFVCLDLNRHRWRSVNGTLGVSNLLMADERPLPVPVGVVETLLELRDPSGSTLLTLRPGELVRVVAGPFADAIGTLDRLDDKGRARVLLDLMSGKVRASLTAAQLEPAV